MNTHSEAKSILITGCSSGIGEHAALALRDRGYQVIASARQQEDVDRLKAQGLHSVQLDLGDDQSIASAIEQTLEITGGKLYALFNNGAYGQPGAIEDLTRDVLRAQLETNLLGWHELTRRLIPIMRAQGAGRIIQNSSVLGLVVIPYRGAYSCSKFALEALSDAMRLELHGTGIHISLIEPGPILSKFRANAHLAFRANIDVENSPHREQYRAAEVRLQKEGPAQPFTLGPEAVTAKLIHALESPRPKPRYYVTFPTYLLGYLRRILSSRGLDAAMRKVSGGGKR